MRKVRLLLVDDQREYERELKAELGRLVGVSFDFSAMDVLAQVDPALVTPGGGEVDVLILSVSSLEGGDLSLVERAKSTYPNAAIIGLLPEGNEELETRLLSIGVQDCFLRDQGPSGTLSVAGWARAILKGLERFRYAHGFKKGYEELTAAAADQVRELTKAKARMKMEAEERIYAEKALVESARRYRFLSDCMPQIIWAATPAGSIFYYNQFWERFSGRSVEETLENGAKLSIHPEDLEMVRFSWKRSIQTGQTYQLEYRLLSVDGGYRWHLARAVPRLDRSGKILEWVGTATDIEEQKRNEERLKQVQDELEVRIDERTSELASAYESLKAEMTERIFAESEALRAREVAEAANIAKSEFLANTSHEIRTPMNGILGMTELALSTELTDVQREHLLTVKNSAESLLSLLNDMLDFAKIEAGKLRMEIRPLLIRRVLQDSVKTLAARAEQKKLQLSLDISDDVPRQGYGDEDRLRQILVNLVGNAVKFTDSGGRVVVKAQVLYRKEAKETTPLLSIQITDTGIGIQETKRDQIFEAFSQADGSTSRRFGGTGLGLAIVSGLVNEMCGAIHLQSEVGVGSTFEILLPILEAPAVMATEPVEVVDAPTLKEPAAKSEPIPLEAPKKALKILVAEDNLINQKVARGILLERGHSVDIASNGVEALTAVNAARYDVVLMDVQMPEMDGLEATRQIRQASDEIKNVPILAVTAHAIKGDREKCIEAGVDDYISKPFNKQELIQLVEALGNR